MVGETFSVVTVVVVVVVEVVDEVEEDVVGESCTEDRRYQYRMRRLTGSVLRLPSRRRRRDDASRMFPE